MAVNSTHPEYDASALDWSRARDVLSGEDAVKAAGEKYLPRLDSQTDDEFAAYRKRASFFNATARTADGYVGLMFRRPPFVKVPESNSGVGRALADFVNDADMLGTTLAAYAKNVVWEVMGVGRAGSLVDWEGGSATGQHFEERAYVSLYSAEQIINWQIGRVNGRNVPTLVVLKEVLADGHRNTGPAGDEFVPELVEQFRVLRLVAGDTVAGAGGKREYHCQVDIWQPKADQKQQRGTKTEWQLVETKTPLRLGKPLPLIPFVFHGPRHSLPSVDRLPLSDMIAVKVASTYYTTAEKARKEGEKRMVRLFEGQPGPAATGETPAPRSAPPPVGPVQPELPSFAKAMEGEPTSHDLRARRPRHVSRIERAMVAAGGVPALRGRSALPEQSPVFDISTSAAFPV